MPLKIVRNDITKIEVDAIVNAANTSLKMGGGVCGAIFKTAGASELQKECNDIGYCETGKSVITSGYALSAKYIIHTPGPVWSGGNNNEDKLLYNSYFNSLNLAVEYNCKSIAFPLISTGIYGYPKEQAIEIAQKAIRDFLSKCEMIIYLVVFDKNSFAISKKRFLSIKQYIDDIYAGQHLIKRRSMKMEMEYLEAPSMINDSADLKVISKVPLSTPISNLNNVIKKIEETFSEMLIRLIDEKGMTDPEAYKKANIDRKHFSKIRSNKDYAPSKVTVIVFAIALELNLDETLDLLKKAGYTLSHSNKFDIIIEYFINEEIYDVFEINEALFVFDQMLLEV